MRLQALHCGRVPGRLWRYGLETGVQGLQRNAMHLWVVPAVHEEEHDEQVRIRLHLWQQANRAGASGICGWLVPVTICFHGSCCL